MIADFKHKIRKSMDDFVKMSAEEDLTPDQRRSLARSHNAMLRLLEQGEDANSICHTMLGLISAIVMRTTGPEDQREAMSDMLKAFQDYMSLHIPEDAPAAVVTKTRH